MPWYVFNGGMPNDPSDPNQYSLTANNGALPPSCLGNQRMCGLQASDSGGHPIITITLFREIIRALNNRMSSTNVTLKS